MKIRKEYIAAAIIIVASVLYLFFRSDSRMNYEIPQLSAVEKGDIISVSMEGPDGKIQLKKEGENWKLSPQDKRASESEVNRLLSELSTLSIVDLISPRDDYARYELDDEKAVSLKASSKDGTVRELKIGKTSSTSIYTYVRLPDRKGVYSVRGNLKSVFSLSTDKWRDKQVLKFNPDEAASVEIVKNDETITLTKASGTENPGWSRDGEVLENSDEMDNHMKTLAMLKTSAFLENEPEGEAQATVTITTSSGAQILNIFEKGEKGYIARSSYVDEPFLLPFYIGDMILKL